MGFMQKHSTIHQLLHLTDTITQDINFGKKTTQAVFLDVEKAFDNIWHDGLIHKLHQLKFPTYLLKILM